MENLKIKQALTGFGQYDYNIIYEIMGIPCYISSFHFGVMKELWEVSFKRFEDLKKDFTPKVKNFLKEAVVSVKVQAEKPNTERFCKTFIQEEDGSIYLTTPEEEDFEEVSVDNTRIFEIIERVKEKGITWEQFYEILKNEELGY